jgi:hypothetical protein
MYACNDAFSRNTSPDVEASGAHCHSQLRLMALQHRVVVQRPTRDLVASVCIITAGTALAGYGEVNASIIGMIIQLVSESAEAGRLIMTQTLLQVCTHC